MPNFKKIEDFHKKFGLEYGGLHRQLPDDLQKFRNICLQEELDEYLVAVKNKDLVEQFDALIDLVYFAMGTAYISGFPFDEGFDIVHAANMNKERVKKAKGSKRNSSFDVIKSVDWKAPDLKSLLQKQYRQHYSLGE